MTRLRIRAVALPATMPISAPGEMVGWGFVRVSSGWGVGRVVELMVKLVGLVEVVASDVG